MSLNELLTREKGTNISQGAHRLYSHRSYTASTPLHLFLLIGGAAASQGSALWWAREHRAHHRYTDTELDPHSADEGFFWTHMGWIIFRKEIPPGPTDIRDLKANKLVMFQHRHYFKIFPWLAFVLPTVIPGYFWGDWAGGLFYSTLLRLTVTHHVRILLLLFLPPRYLPFNSPSSALTLLPTGLVRLRSMTSIRPATIFSLPSSPWVKDTITSTTNSLSTTGMLSSGTNMTLPNGSFSCLNI